jgi:hypothetical protein
MSQNIEIKLVVLIVSFVPEERRRCALMPGHP